MFIVLEGPDGTGKTTFASRAIRKQIFSKPVMYVKFEKANSYHSTKLSWLSFAKALKPFTMSHTVITDRSFISTIAYQSNYEKGVSYKEFVESELRDAFSMFGEDDQVLIIMFNEIHDKSKLLEYAGRVESIKKNYTLIRRILKEMNFTVVDAYSHKDFLVGI